MESGITSVLHYLRHNGVMVKLMVKARVPELCKNL